MNEGEKRLLTRNAKVEQQERDDENLTVERPTFVTHLECSATGERYPADELHNLSRAGKPLLVRYDLAEVKKSLSREALAQRPHDFWRYRELLPVRRTEDIVSLGEAVIFIAQGYRRKEVFDPGIVRRRAKRVKATDVITSREDLHRARDFIRCDVLLAVEAIER